MTGFKTDPQRRLLLKGLAGAASAALPLALHAATQAAPQRGGTLRAAITGFNTINTLDPAKASLIPEFYVGWAVFNTLLKFNSRMQIVPDLAQSYRAVGSDVLEFKLRPNVRFHDGSKLTAEDVKFSLERVMNEKTASPSRSKLMAVRSIDAIDPLTVRITTKSPYAPLLAYLTNTRSGTQIVSRKAVTQMGDEAFARKPVGTGAFMVQDWQSNQSVELVANPNYFIPGQPHLQRVSMPLIAEESSGMTALLGGQVDLTSTAPFADIASLEKRSDVKVYRQPGLNTRYVALNTRKAPFDDVHFRRAVSMAFDRRIIIQNVAFGEGLPTGGLFPPALNAAFGLPAKTPVPEYCTFNPEHARAELARSKYGRDAKATVFVFGSAFWHRFGELFVAQVNQVLGTDFKIEALDANAAFAKLRAGDYQAGVWGYLGLIDPDEYLGDLLGAKGSKNFYGYENKRFEDLLVRGREELNAARRGAIYQVADQMWVEDMPIIPCFCTNVHNLASSRVKGFEQAPYSNFGDQFGNIEIS